MRIHAKVLNTRNASILFGALSMHLATNLPPASNVEGYLPAPAVFSPPLIFTKQAADTDFAWDMVYAGQKLNRQPNLRPIAIRDTTVSDPSTVFLLSRQDDDMYAMGSGTIIKGDLDTHRVVTAGHVSDKNGVPHAQTLMFDGEGKYLGELSPVMIVHQQSDLRLHGATSLMNDMAVMSVSSFATHDAAEGWNDRAVSIAQEQPAHPLFIANGIGDTTLNSGMSGASVRNTHNEVVGVYLTGTKTTDLIAPNTPDRLDYTFAHGKPPCFSGGMSGCA